MMNKILTVALLVLFGLCDIYAATGKAGSKITWELDEQGTLTFSGSGTMKDFGETPYRPDLVKTAVIKEGIVNIGANAFKGCSKMTDVSIPSSCQSIGNKAFAGCTSLPAINIPYGVVYIGKEAFAGCRFTEIILPGGVKSIGEQAFKNCNSLVKVRIPASVNTLGKNTFKGCKYINVITELPEFVTPGMASLYDLNRNMVAEYWKRQQGETTANTEKQIVTIDQIPSVNQPVSLSSSLSSRLAASKNEKQGSDVDVAIPHVKVSNEKTFAVIISNENYARMEKVPYALNDGHIFQSYCENTLGIPPSNIMFYEDATSGTMREILSDLDLAAKIMGKDMKLIFYYSGHGGPDSSTGTSYLIPIDASRVNQNICIALSELYNSLGNLDIELTTVFIDACFSGGERNGGNLLAVNGERTVKIKQPEISPIGRMVVFSAADGDQTALPYDEQQHGIFTYYLLKKLQESNGNASLAELADYIQSNVSQTAFKKNRKIQTPVVSASSDINDTWGRQRLNN